VQQYAPPGPGRLGSRATAGRVRCVAHRWHPRSIHTQGDGRTWVLFAACRSPRHWMANKARLSFCTITNEGDDEGALRLHEPPTARQARDPRGPRHPQAAGDLRVNAGAAQGLRLRAEHARRGDLGRRDWQHCLKKGGRFCSPSTASRALCRPSEFLCCTMTDYGEQMLESWIASLSSARSRKNFETTARRLLAELSAGGLRAATVEDTRDALGASPLTCPRPQGGNMCSA